MMENIRAKNTKVAGNTICGKHTRQVGCGLWCADTDHTRVHTLTRTFMLLNIYPAAS